ncbi:hypothetical protein AAMO2058_001134800 [Amorphochlora amoebiformis]
MGVSCRDGSRRILRTTSKTLWESLSHPNTSSRRLDQFAANERVILPRLSPKKDLREHTYLALRWALHASFSGD